MGEKLISRGERRLKRENVQRAMVSHSLVFIYVQEFGYYVLFGARKNEVNHCDY